MKKKDLSFQYISCFLVKTLQLDIVSTEYSALEGILHLISQLMGEVSVDGRIDE